MTPLPTKAAEIRAGLVERLHDLASPERVKHGVPQDVAMTEAAALIEQQAAELAEARAELVTFVTAHALADKRATTAESERDELLREKERLGVDLGGPKGWAEQREELSVWTRSAFLAGEKVGNEAGHKHALYAFLCGLSGWLLAAEEAARAVLCSTSQDSGQDLADAHSKSPAPSSEALR